MTAYDPDRHHRRSIRLRGYDYTMAGVYFVTICVQGRQCLFGDVTDGVMQWNDAGRIVADTWQWLADQYPHVELDEWVVMPNHLHGIIVITDGRGGSCKGGSRTAPTARKPLGRIIGAFKTVSTKHINIMRATTGCPVWQRNYYEHIIRDEKSLSRIRDYIANNSRQWPFDHDNPAAITLEDKNAWQS